MKKHLLIGTTILALALSATSIYAQVVSGTSIVDKMKAVAHSFTLSTELNAGQTGLTSEPVKGKKTGDILTAGEWNRMLEIVSQGSTDSSGGSGWVDIPLTNTSDYDTSCEYRFQMSSPFIDGNWSFGAPTPAGNHYYYATYIANNMIAASGTYNVMHGIPKATKNRVFLYWLHGTGVDSWATTKIEKLCGGRGDSGGNSNITWANFNGSGSVAMKGSNGITSIVRESAGNYRVTFSTPRPDADYGIICTSGPSPSYLCFPHEKSPTSFLIKTSNPTNNVDAPFVSLIVTPFDAGVSSGAASVYTKCTNAQSADSSNIPCYAASRGTGAGTDQYRVMSCTINDGVRTYTAASILNFNNLVANKWAISVNGGTIECVDGSILVAKIQ